MPSQFGGVEVATPAPSSGSQFGGIPVGEQSPDPGFLGTLWHDLKQINPTNTGALARALVTHPIDTIKAAVGTMDLDHPENSSGLLGLPDELYEQWKAGHKGEAIAHEVEAAAPILFKGAGALAGSDAAAAVASTVKGAVKGAVQAVPEAAATSALKYTGLPQLTRGAINGIREQQQLRLWNQGVAASKAAAAERPPLAPEIPAAPPVPAEDPQLLDDIAQGQAGKKFAKLEPAAQQTVREIARRFNSGAPPEQPTPTPAPATPPPAAAPAPAPEPPTTPGKTIADIAREELTPQTEPQPETPAPAKPSKGKMSRAQAQAADEYSLRRSQKSAEELAQFITKNPAQAQQVLDYLDNPGLPDGAPQEVVNQARDINWTNLKHSMKQDQLARIQQAGGNVTQSDVMDLKNVSSPSLVTRRLAVQRVQEILKQQKAAQAATAAPRTGMGAMKNYSGYNYNPAALTDEQIAALTR